MVAVLGLVAAGIISNLNHGNVQKQALHQLQASFAKGKSSGSTPKGSQGPTSPSTSTGATSSGLSSGLGDLSASLPIGPIAVNGDTGGSSTTPAPSASAAPGSNSSNGGKTPSGGSAPTSSINIAVLTPFLKTAQFGASVGFLLVCNTAAGSLSAAAAQVPGLLQVISPVITQISPDCSKLSASAVTYLNMFNSELGGLQGLNADSQAYFNQLNLVFATLNKLAPDLQPFTGTITALGPLVDFFASQPQGS
jgi:hypothetical protein